MTIERTLSIIKPDATRRNLVGKICDKLESTGLRIIAQKRIWLTKEQAQGFYAVHRGRDFFDGLVDYMISGPIVVQVLEGDEAIHKNREVMGTTDPKTAKKGTIRQEFGETLRFNSVHGSDSTTTAAWEIKYFFNEMEIVG